MKGHPITRGELWQAQAALGIAIILQAIVWGLNRELTYGPHNIMLATEIFLALVIGLTAGKRHLRPSRLYRGIAFLLIGLISLANISSLFLVSQLLIKGVAGLSGRELLVAALAIFVTNVIVFALWYWEIDSPGLSGSKWSRHDKDFHFIQENLHRDYPGWQPVFGDYLYLSLTNGINFAPADSHPITGQAKLLMGTQAMVSVFTLALVLARSVSILG